MTTSKIFAVATCLFVFGCSGGTEQTEPNTQQAVTKSVTQALPPIEVRSGDGLPDLLPANLTWETNDTDQVFASPEAKRGGTFRTYMLSFPLTLRRVGPDSNGTFAGVMRSNQLSPVSIHPQTRRPIPSMATQWAFGDDGRTLFYRLNPAARWSRW